MFGAAIPTFNLRGKKDVKTSVGACASIIIIVLTLLFALLKFEHLTHKKNPMISTNTSSLGPYARYNTG